MDPGLESIMPSDTISAILADLPQNLLSFYTDAQGELNCLPYYISHPSTPFYNKQYVTQLGLEPATDRNEVMTQCQLAQQKLGISSPWFASMVGRPSQLDHRPVFRRERRRAVRRER